MTHHELKTDDAPVAVRSRYELIGPLILAAGGFFLLGMRQTFTVPLTFGLSLGQFLLYIGAALWAVAGVSGKKSPIANRWLVIALAGYLTASLLSYGAAMSRG